MMAAMSTTALLPTTKSAFIFASCLGIADVVIWHTAIPKRRKRNAEELAELPSISKCLKTVLTNKYVWLAGIGNFCVCGAMVAVSSLISAALVTRGMDEASAGLVSSINLFGNLAGSLFVPLVAHKTGRLRLILVVCSIITAVGTAFSWRMPFGLLLYVSLFLTGVGVGSVLPQLIAICIKLPGIGPAYAGTAGGFTTTLQLLGGVVMPAHIAAAIAGDNFHLYFIIAGAFMIVCAAAMARLPKEVDG
jgi:NNP family nitrate/nitrite transporter-like MFS transporter